MSEQPNIFDLRSILGAQIRRAGGARDYDPTTVNLAANLIEVRLRPVEAAALSTHLDRLTAENAQPWLVTAVGESMTHTGPFHEAAELAERSWIASKGDDEGALVWKREADGAWSLLHQDQDGGLMSTEIKVRAR